MLRYCFALASDVSSEDDTEDGTDDGTGNRTDGNNDDDGDDEDDDACGAETETWGSDDTNLDPTEGCEKSNGFALGMCGV